MLLDGLAAHLELGEGAGGLLALLAQGALGGQQGPQLFGLTARHAIEGGGLVEVAVGVGGEQQLEGGVDGAVPVLGGGDHAEGAPHPVDLLLAAGDPVGGLLHALAQGVGALARRVEPFGGPLGLLVEPVELGLHRPRGLSVVGGVAGPGGRGGRREGGSGGGDGGGQYGDPDALGETGLRRTAMGRHWRAHSLPLCAAPAAR